MAVSDAISVKCDTVRFVEVEGKKNKFLFRWFWEIRYVLQGIVDLEVVLNLTEISIEHSRSQY